MPGENSLDSLDFGIIAELHDDGRKPVVEIARALDVPRTTVARRIENLIAQKVIMIGAYAYGPKIGLPIQVFIEMSVDQRLFEGVMDELMAIDELRWIGVAVGPCDIVAEGMVRSHAHLRQLLLSKVGGIPGITQIRTTHILEVRKISFDWEAMLRAAEAAEESAGAEHNVAPHTFG